MSTFLRSQSQVVGLRPMFQARPLLSISSSEFEQIWREVKWDTRRVNSTLDLFSRFCGDDLESLLNTADIPGGSVDAGSRVVAGGSQLMSNHRLVALLRSIAIVGTENENLSGMEFFTRNDLCTIMTGIPYIDRKNFLRLMCLLDRSTPHTTTSPAGISRLKLVFSYYDWGWKGYLDELDWIRLRSDIMNSTYYGKLYERNNENDYRPGLSNAGSSRKGPIPETLEEGLRQLSYEMSARSLRSGSGDSKLLRSDSLHLSADVSGSGHLNAASGNPDSRGHCYASPLPTVSNKDLMIDFPLFVKLVEFRIIRGTSQILRVELPGRDQEVFIARSILANGGSIFLYNYRSENYRSEDLANNISNFERTSSSISNVGAKAESASNLKPESEEINDIEKSKQIISEQIQELDHELNSLKMSIKHSRYSSNSLGLDASNLAEDVASKNAMESVFGPPPEDLHGIFCDRPNDQHDLAFSSIVVPSSSTPVRKSRSMRLNTLPVSPIANNDTTMESNDHSNFSTNRAIPSNDFPNNATYTEVGGPPILL
ncbi:hypothetical protein OJ253_2596 [Cryptosporidium canis]|uniref:Uncharacterized protein n=1 Tax=Cryptosporidium canis TaxID=195482 RepID=A0A9D5HWM3_9CRYT|nr:hypothetical protein OJ253_2596 [Cryptosporidium canis]